MNEDDILNFIDEAEVSFQKHIDEIKDDMERNEVVAIGASNGKRELNFLRRNVSMFTAMLLEGRPSAHAWPSDGNDDDIEKVKIANGIISYVDYITDINAVDYRAVTTCQHHGTVYYKVTWDPEAGRDDSYVVGMNDDGTAIYQEFNHGDVDIGVVRFTDIVTDGSTEVEDSRFVIIKSMVSKEKAKELVGSEDFNEYTGGDKDLWGVELSGVEVKEVFHLPSEDDAGWSAVVVGGVVVQHLKRYPYEHGRLPLAELKMVHRHNSPFGATHITDARALQEEINDDAVRAVTAKKRFASNLKIVLPRTLEDELGIGEEEIYVTDEDEAKVIRYIDPPMSYLSSIYATIDRNRELIAELFPVSSNIRDNTKGQSGRAIAFKKEWESIGLSDVIVSLARCKKNMYNQVLDLYKQYAEADRVVDISGYDNERSAVMFNREMITGTEIRLEPYPGVNNMRSAASEQAQTAMMAGSQDPGLPGQARTGIRDYDQEAEFSILRRQLDELQNGNQVQPSEYVSRQTAMQFFREQITSNPGIEPVVQALAQIYAQVWAQQTQQAKQAQAEPTMQAEPTINEAERLPQTPIG